MSNAKIELNGVIITGRVDGLDQMNIQLLRRETDKRVVRQFTSEMTFYDDGYQIIRDVLINPAEGLTSEVNIRILDDCCGFDVLFQGVIMGDQIDWCEDECSVTAEAVERTDNSTAYDCLRSTYVWDNREGFKTRQHPEISYCMEIRPNFLHDLLILYMTLENFSLNSMLPLVASVALVISTVGQICEIINLIINAINTIPGINVGNLNCPPVSPITIIQQYNQFRQEMNQRVSGCGRSHTSPLVRDYIKNVCDICGVTFQSSIINDPASDYYDMVWLQAPVRQQRFTESGFNEDNKVLLTGEAMLNELVKVFNGDWWLKDGVLEFERRDHFIGLEEWVDTTGLGDNLISSVCFEWLPDPFPAAIDIKYQEDFLDEVGNEGMKRYSEIINVNEPFRPNQKGVREILIPFSPSRNRDDNMERDVISFWANVPIINSISGGVLDDFHDVLLMSKGICFLPKLLIWNGVFGIGRVRKYPITLDNAEVAFNYPLWVDPTRPGNLWDRFWEIEDPRVRADVTHQWTFTMKITCENIRTFDFLKFVTLKKGGKILQGIPTEVDLDLENRTATVKGLI